jgi:hypothetical protein
MPRQPYPPNLAAPVYGPAQTRTMPKIAELVGRCIMQFSYVDWQMALLLAEMMKASSEASVAIFLTLRNARAQRDVLIAAAQMTLKDRNKEIFNALMIVYASLQSQRADIAHGIFGLAPQTTDTAAWIETKNLSAHWIETFYKPPKPGAEVADIEAAEVANLKKLTSIYTAPDLERLEEDIRNLWLTAFHFTVFLGNKYVASVPQELERLCTLPQMAQALAQTRTPKSTSEPPAQ